MIGDLPSSYNPETRHAGGRPSSVAVMPCNANNPCRDATRRQRTVALPIRPPTPYITPPASSSVMPSTFLGRLPSSIETRRSSSAKVNWVVTRL